ncbi:unnamed protein product [Closterium sp. NIES-54]
MRFSSSLTQFLAQVLLEIGAVGVDGGLRAQWIVDIRCEGGGWGEGTAAGGAAGPATGAAAGPAAGAAAGPAAGVAAGPAACAAADPATCAAAGPAAGRMGGGREERKVGGGGGGGGGNDVMGEAGGRVLLLASLQMPLMMLLWVGTRRTALWQIRAREEWIWARKVQIWSRDLVALSVDLVARRADLVARSADLDARNADLDAQNADLVTKCADLGEGGVDMGAGGVDLGAGGVDLGAGVANLSARRADLGDGRADLGAGRADLSAGRSDLGAGRADLGAGRSDLGAGVADLDIGKPGFVFNTRVRITRTLFRGQLTRLTGNHTALAACLPMAATKSQLTRLTGNHTALAACLPMAATKSQLTRLTGNHTALAACLPMAATKSQVLEAYGNNQSPVLVVGDLVNIHFTEWPESDAALDLPFERSSECPTALLIKPATAMFFAAELFVRETFQRERFIGMHWRRGDFKAYCFWHGPKNACYFPVQQVAYWVYRKMRELGINNLFLATNAKHAEVRVCATNAKHAEMTDCKFYILLVFPSFSPSSSRPHLLTILCSLLTHIRPSSKPPAGGANSVAKPNVRLQAKCRAVTIRPREKQGEMDATHSTIDYRPHGAYSCGFRKADLCTVAHFLGICGVDLFHGYPTIAAWLTGGQL